MAQRHEIEAWVNPSTWADPDEAARVIDAIEASGSDDEAEWVELASGCDEGWVAGAVFRSDLRIEVELSDLVAAYHAADAARADLEAALARYHRQGITKYRLARITGLPDRTIGRMINRRS